MNYQDEYGIYHDRSDRISGNGVLYSAFALQMDMYSPEQIMKTKQALRGLVSTDIGTHLIHTYRYFENDQPDSLDNLVGFIKWELLNADQLERAGWYFRGKADSYKRYSWLDVIKTAWKHRKGLLSDRNYFRDNNLDEIGKIAYWIPWQYRYYAKAKVGRPPTLLEKISFYGHCIATSFKKDHSKNTSPKNIVVLMLEDLDSKYLIKLFNKELQYTEYFGESHPFVKKVRNG